MAAISNPTRFQIFRGDSKLLASAESSSTRFQIFGRESILFKTNSLLETLNINEDNRSNRFLILAIYQRVLEALGEDTKSHFNAQLNDPLRAKKNESSTQIGESRYDAHIGGRVCQVSTSIAVSIFSSIASPMKPKPKDSKVPKLGELEALGNTIKKLTDKLSLAKKFAPADFEFKKFDLILENWAIFLIHLIFINSCHSVKLLTPQGIVIRKLEFKLNELTNQGKNAINKKVIENTLSVSKAWAYSLSTSVVIEMLNRSSLPEKESLLKLLDVKVHVGNRAELPFFPLTKTVFRTTTHPIQLKVRTLKSVEFPYLGVYVWNGSTYVRSEPVNGPIIVVEAYGNFDADQIDNSIASSSENIIERIIKSYGGLIEYIEAQAAEHDQFSELQKVKEKFQLAKTPKKLSLAELANIPALKNIKNSIDPTLLTLENKCQNSTNNGLTIEHVFLTMCS